MTVLARIQRGFTETLDCHSRERGNPSLMMRRVLGSLDSCLMQE
jgi:hypothetical protein